MSSTNDLGDKDQSINDRTYSQRPIKEIAKSARSFGDIDEETRSECNGDCKKDSHDGTDSSRRLAFAIYSNFLRNCQNNWNCYDPRQC